jgi:tetratricopeptide (TPR) repeat protein
MIIVLALLFSAQGRGQTESAAGQKGPLADRGRILLVLPFDNRTGQPSLEWMREAAAEILSSRFTSAGFSPMSRADRLYALDHLGLPEGFQPSRASSLKLAQTLDADSIIVGSYRTDGDTLSAEAQIVDVPHLRMTPPVTASGPLRDMISIFGSLAWRLTLQLDPTLNVSEETFIAAGKGLRLDAFEQYIRGITEPDQAERLGHLEKAVKLSPDFSPAWMALGREDYNGQKYEQAAAAFAKVRGPDADALEAGFYRGLALLFSGEYAQAEQAFSGVAQILPLAEVLNNQAVAESRQGHDGSALFRRAVTDDPNNADYHFNLAVSLNRHGAKAEAIAQMAQCLRLRPNDSEAQSVLAAWKSPAHVPPTATEEDSQVDPLERIVRTFDAAAFRQAALMLDQMEAARLAVLPAHERALKLAAQARDYLNRGLLLEAERLFQSAVAADGTVADAHVGLAEVRERTGNVVAARKEAETALQLEPSAGAYLVLARLDFAANRLDEANQEAGKCLQLESTNRAAKELLRQIQAKTGKKQ